jgi:hypothetical protein
MLTKRYLTSVKNLPAIMDKIVEGTAPTKFTIAHLKSLGFSSSNDRGMLALLKDLRFLSDDGTPSPRYHEYRDASRSRAIMAEALRETYEDLFHISEKPGPPHRAAIEGKIKSALNVSDRVAKESASTFLALLKLADLDAPPSTPLQQDSEDSGREETDEKTDTGTGQTPLIPPPGTIGLRYNVEIHLPASKDIGVYNAIFKSLKEHLLDN